MSALGWCSLHGKAFTHGCPGCAVFMEDLAIAAQIRERDASDTSERLTLEQLASEHGIDLDALRNASPSDPASEGDTDG